MTTKVTTQQASNIPSDAGSSGGGYSRRRAARIAGVSYLALFVLAIFANFGVREGLVEPGDAVGTVANISGSIGLFRLGVAAFVAIFVLDVVISWALHVVFRDIQHDVSLAAAWFRLIYTALLGVGIVSMFQVLDLLGGDSLAFLTTEQTNAQTMIELARFESAWLIGLVAFGIHVAMVGVLVLRSGLVARALGYLLIAAGLAYVIDTLAHGLLADYQAVADVLLVAVALPSMIGEGWLGLWLLLARRIEH